ncbi:glycoside hydrolase family 43 protein [Ruminococcus sp. Marseille-P6503]|uniref:glycoside hydrolase family 43 protein n=1 Tax=Ruminococcus sp. Marseille-P6503 TaxID=2364796 RepID=UPI000F542882|nr:glycoside hydrolase family 43 protein [Ruminococcus sp. Marseille-P6503]
MKYTNPVVKGFYPDPSVCSANGKYYMVCSSFQYFPGVPLFESPDLVNWTQIGYVLTRENQVMLDKINSSGGVFAPTIRYNGGRFYMVTTNDTTRQNFYVYTDDIYGEWSDPVYVDQGGIDPSLFFEDGKTYFMSNGLDDEGRSGVIQCEINIETGEKLSKSICIWQGSGGRYLESPHMYKINGSYYLMAAEGGTEYGHMITYARADSVWGEFVGYAGNPVLTNRNKAPYLIQGIGHGDLIRDKNGDWHILCLGFRQIHMWMPYHNLGREVFLIPVKFSADGWFTAGRDGTAEYEYEIKGDFEQKEKKLYTFKNTSWKIDWCHLRRPDFDNYEFYDDSIVLHGSGITLDDADSPAFIALRQRDFEFELSVRLSVDGGEAGVTCYMCEDEHYDIALRKSPEGTEAVLKLNIGGIKHIENTVELSSDSAVLIVRGDNFRYNFYAASQGSEIYLGSGNTKYLTSEVSGGFTGVMLGLYSIGRNSASFSDFSCNYK